MKALLLAGAVLILAATLPAAAQPESGNPSAIATAPARGIVRQVSSYGFDETIRRIRADLGMKNIRIVRRRPRPPYPAS